MGRKKPIKKNSSASSDDESDENAEESEGSRRSSVRFQGENDAKDQTGELLDSKEQKDSESEDIQLPKAENEKGRNSKNQFTSVSMKQKSQENEKKSIVPEKAAPNSPKADDQAISIDDPLHKINLKRQMRVQQKEEARLARLANSSCSEESYNLKDAQK